MAYIFGYQLTNYTLSIIELLYIHRGMTALQLAQMMYSFDQSESQEKSVYNHLRKLKKQSLVESLKLQQNVNPGSLYYLTSKGLEVAKQSLDIIPGQYGNGFVKEHSNGNYDRLGDLPYEVYKPPLKQIPHHLMSIDFFNQVRGLTEVDYRIGLYAKRKFSSPLQVNSEKSFIRPDAEISIEGIGNYFVEFDRATEGHVQLRMKFNNYAEYCEYLKGGDEPLPTGILFIVESKRKTYGMFRRWENVLSAFLEEMSKFSEEVNLIMLTLDQVQDALAFEKKRRETPSPYAIKLYKRLKDKGYSILRWNYKGEPFYSLVMDDISYQIYFVSCGHPIESLAYVRFSCFLEELPYIKQKEEVKELTYMNYKWNSIITYGESLLVSGFEKYNLPDTLKEAFKIIDETEVRILKTDL